MGRTYKDGSQRTGRRALEEPPPLPPPRRERSAVVTPAGSVSIIDAPLGWPNELLIAGDSYGKALFTPTKRGKARIIYTRLYPLPLAVQDKLYKAFEYDQAHRIS